MHVLVEKTSTLGRHMTIEVFAERIEKAIDERLAKLSKKVKVAGFRPGKVPFNIIKQHHGEAVRSEVIHDIMQTTFYEAVIKEKLKLAGAPRIHHDHDHHPQAGEALKFTAEFDIFPEIKIGGFKTLKIEKTIAKITAMDLEKTIIAIRKQHVQWETIERSAQIGDQVNIDFEGNLDGKSLPNGKASNFAVELGSGNLLADLEQGLNGVVAGQKLVIDATFPANYPHPDIAGKVAQFKIYVHSVKVAKLPALDDEFAALLGVKEGGFEKLHSDVRQNLERELAQILKNKLKQSVMDALYESNKFDLPTTLVKAEIHRLQEEMRPRFDNQINFQAFLERNDNEFEAQACRRISLGLILAEIINQHELKPDTDKVSKLIANLAATYENPEEAAKWFYQDKKHRHEIENLVLEEQVIEKVLAVAQLSEKNVSFDEATQKK